MIAVLLIILVTVLFSSLYLMLWFGYRNSEEERAANENAAEHLQALDGPRFFANLGPDLTADPATIAPAALIQHFEDHVRQEREVVAEFVNEPTMERLFPDATGLADTMARDLEHRIRHDVAATRGFFAEPSVEMLFRDLGVTAT